MSGSPRVTLQGVSDGCNAFRRLDSFTDDVLAEILNTEHDERNQNRLGTLTGITATKPKPRVPLDVSTNRLQDATNDAYRIVRLARWGNRILDSIFQASRRKSSTSSCLLLRKYPFVSIFLYEIHNFLCRIELLCSKSFWEVDAGARYQVEACWMSCSEYSDKRKH